MNAPPISQVHAPARAPDSLHSHAGSDDHGARYGHGARSGHDAGAGHGARAGHGAGDGQGSGPSRPHLAVPRPTPAMRADASRALTTQPRLLFPHVGAERGRRAVSRRAGRAGRRLATSLLLALVGIPLGLAVSLGLAAPAYADDCAGCAEPTVESLTQNSGLRLQDREADWWLGGSARDYLCVDAGECTTVIEPTGVQQIRNASLQFRGSSVSMTCPWGNVAGTMVFRTLQSDNTNWSVSFSLSGEFGTPLSKFGFKAEGEFGQSTTVTRVTEHRVNATAKYCHVLSVAAYFLIQDIDVPAVATRTRRYAWWTKNPATGSAVHQRGNVHVPCSSEPVTLTTRASVSVHVNTVVTICPWGCEGVGVTQGSTGLLPPVPPGVAVPPELGEPRITGDAPDEGEPDPAGHGGDDPDPRDEPPVHVAPDGDDGR